jgi:hypothetical protein
VLKYNGAQIKPDSATCFVVTATDNNNSPSFSVMNGLASVCLDPDIADATVPGGTARGIVFKETEVEAVLADREKSSVQIHLAELDGTSANGCVHDLGAGRYFIKLTAVPTTPENARFIIEGY